MTKEKVMMTSTSHSIKSHPFRHSSKNSTFSSCSSTRTNGNGWAISRWHTWDKVSRIWSWVTSKSLSAVYRVPSNSIFRDKLFPFLHFIIMDPTRRICRIHRVLNNCVSMSRSMVFNSCHWSHSSINCVKRRWILDSKWFNCLSCLNWPLPPILMLLKRTITTILLHL